MRRTLIASAFLILAASAASAAPVTERSSSIEPVSSNLNTAKVAAPGAVCASYRAANPTSAITAEVCRQAKEAREAKGPRQGA
jgi:hypothetical protein